MELASRPAIPEPPIAVIGQLSENSRLGFGPAESTLFQGAIQVKYLNGVRDTTSVASNPWQMSLKAQQQIHTETTITVHAKTHWWNKVGSWFGSATHSVSYAFTAFVITHSKLAMEGNRSGFEYWSKQSNEEIIKSLNPGGKEPMQIRMDGENAKIMQGNTRYSILQSRGADLSGLKPDVLPPVEPIGPLVEPTVEPMVEPMPVVEPVIIP